MVGPGPIEKTPTCTAASYAKTRHSIIILYSLGITGQTLLRRLMRVNNQFRTIRARCCPSGGERALLAQRFGLRSSYHEPVPPAICILGAVVLVVSISPCCRVCSRVAFRPAGSQRSFGRFLGSGDDSGRALRAVCEHGKQPGDCAKWQPCGRNFSGMHQHLCQGQAGRAHKAC